MAGPKQAGDWSLGVGSVGAARGKQWFAGHTKAEASFCVCLNSWFVFLLVWFGSGLFWELFLVSQAPCLLGGIAAAGSCRCELTSADPCSCVFACLNFVCTENAIVGPHVSTWLWGRFYLLLEKEVISAEEVKLVMDRLPCHWCTLEMQLLNLSTPTPPSLCPSPFFAFFISKSR